MWHGLYQFDVEEDDMPLGWYIVRENRPDEFLYIRGGKYIEWTKQRDDALQFFRHSDATAFAEFFFGTPNHGHSIGAGATA